MPLYALTSLPISLKWGNKKSTLMKLRKKQSGKELRVDATVANIREEENTNPKIPHNIPVYYMMLENDPAERKPKKGSRQKTGAPTTKTVIQNL